ncbi:MAG: hypothetical protein IJH13_01235 [Bacilli bacterium]|nr:hypothetical protein [Bacilli bacterium]
MAISEQSIEEQIAIINEQKELAKEITTLRMNVERYREAIVATLNSVDKRKATPALEKQIRKIDIEESFTLMKNVLGLGSINITYKPVQGKLLNTTYSERKQKL